MRKKMAEKLRFGRFDGQNWVTQTDGWVLHCCRFVAYVALAQAALAEIGPFPVNTFV
jgi:hypothetical protein